VADALLKLKFYEKANILSDIRVPALVIGAQKDRLPDFAASEEIHRDIAASILITVEQGHQSMVENPGATNDAVRSFLLANS